MRRELLKLFTCYAILVQDAAGINLLESASALASLIKNPAACSNYSKWNASRQRIQ